MMCVQTPSSRSPWPSIESAAICSNRFLLTLLNIIRGIRSESSCWWCYPLVAVNSVRWVVGSGVVGGVKEGKKVGVQKVQKPCGTALFSTNSFCWWQSKYLHLFITNSFLRTFISELASAFRKHPELLLFVLLVNNALPAALLLNEWCPIVHHERGGAVTRNTLLIIVSSKASTCETFLQ